MSKDKHIETVNKLKDQADLLMRHVRAAESRGDQKRADHLYDKYWKKIDEKRAVVERESRKIHAENARLAAINRGEAK